MLEFGFNARHHGDYFYSWDHEVSFAKKNNFDFLQLYCDGATRLTSLKDQYVEIKKAGFPTVIHAVLEINDINSYMAELVKATLDFKSQDLIIHPINKNNNSINDLSGEIGVALGFVANKGLKLYLENNSLLDPIFHSAEELELIFENNPELNLLLDLAHIDNYDHLEDMLKVKRPGILHIADRDLNVIHDHRPIGDGNINFQKIFTEILPSFHGKIILELSYSDQEIIKSKEIIQNILKEKNGKSRANQGC